MGRTEDEPRKVVRQKKKNVKYPNTKVSSDIEQARRATGDS